VNILDSGPGSLTGMAAVIVFVIRLVVAVAKRWRATQDKAMSQVPPSPQLEPPKTDPHVLTRLDRVEHESALSVALVRERQAVDDLRRELSETRAQRDQLVVELRASRALVERLRAEIRARRARGAAVEVSAAEHRDASQAGPLQDSLKTPLRPGPR
jgi:hypothetical protein